MSFICGDCKHEHSVPTREDDRNGQPCVDALVRDRDQYRAALERIWKRLNDTLSASENIGPELAGLCLVGLKGWRVSDESGGKK